MNTATCLPKLEWRKEHSNMLAASAFYQPEAQFSIKRGEYVDQDLVEKVEQPQRSPFPAQRKFGRPASCSDQICELRESSSVERI
jgi:hypothetical protein